MQKLSENKNILPQLRIFLLTVFLVALGALAGWEARALLRNASGESDTGVFLAELRKQAGYHYIDPLIVCNAPSGQGFGENHIFEGKVESFVNTMIKNHMLSDVSVYYQDLNSGNWLGVNDEKTFYPASLEKVPVMMAYLARTRVNSSTLNQTITYISPKLGYNANMQQEIPVKNGIEPGGTYTAQELIEKMIIESDNNATEILYNNLSQDELKQVSDDLGTPFLGKNKKPTDFMTTRAYSLFFRVLYNGTYLPKRYSEAALGWLAQTSFRDALVAGIPQGIEVAHKFGLVSIAPNGNDVTARELHDCGIVYDPDRPYFLCVMTKSSSSLQGIEQSVTDISRFVYQQLH